MSSSVFQVCLAATVVKEVMVADGCKERKGGEEEQVAEYGLLILSICMPLQTD